MHNPEHPVYIISKGRADTMITSRSLSRMKVPHYIVIEPQDYDAYEKALDKFNIRPWVTLIVAPFSNHGDGPGRARNYAWDHSISIGADKHWVMDDNISDFYRLHKNQRIRVESGVMFKICEDFIDRFENVPVSGLQYRFFVAPNQKYPPYVKNTRIYSCLLIENSCKHRWRGRYNEDTILSLDVLKDGYCTIQFNVFLQGKCATQTVKGGNTDEFYWKEKGEKQLEKVEDKGYNPLGTVNKSSGASYPPYNLIRLSNTEAVLEVAVAGFKESEVSVTAEDGYLKISGKKESTDEQPDYLYKSIGARAFQRAFTLSKDAKVIAAEYADGILSVFVTYELPEEKKPKQIPITRGERLYLTE